MRNTGGARSIVVGAVSALLLLLVAACAGAKEIVEVEKEVIVEKEVVKEVPVQVEKVVEVEKEVVKEVVKEVPVEVVKEVEVIKEVPKVITEEKVVVREIEKIVVATPVPLGQAPWTLAAISPNARRGGTFRPALHGPPAHWDVHQSATIANNGPQAPMYDMLLRRDPRDVNMPIVPDLAHRWEISEDGTAFTFYLREGVQWHDGTEFGAEDVKATYDRIVFPPDGIESARQSLFLKVSEINVVDSLTFEMKLGEPVPVDFMLGAFAMGWNMIVQKETLEANDSNLRSVDNYPGTGPFKYSSRDTETWTLERNEDYWNPNAPYMDRIEQVWLKAWTPELSAALLGGLVDWAQWLDVITFRKAGDRSDMSNLRVSYPGRGLGWFNTTKAPFDDARVRRALHLVTDRQGLITAVADIGEEILASWYNPLLPLGRSPEQLLRLPGYRPDKTEDIAEAKRLLAAAGFPDGEGFPEFVIVGRDSGGSKIHATAMQAMFKEYLGLESKIRPAEASVFYQDMLAGDFDLALGGDNPGTHDPAGYLRSMWGKCGDVACSRNFSGWLDDEFDDLVSKLEKNLDPTKTLAMLREIEDLLEREVPVIPLPSGSGLWGWHNHIQGITPGDFAAGYDVFKWDHVWMDR